MIRRGDKNTQREITGNHGDLTDPGIAAMTAHFVDHCMASLGPFVSSVFFALIFNSCVHGVRPNAYIRSVQMSLAGIAQRAGISRRKGVDALKALKNYGIIMQCNGRGRGNRNRYYFLPCETWFLPDDIPERRDAGR